jgi:hypothetical protein
MKPLSQHLADLSIQAKTTEDRVAKAQSEAKEKLDQKREQVRKEAQQALETVQQRVGEARDETRTRFDAMHAKLNSDFDKLRQQASEKKQKFEAWQANNYADDKELDAIAAIDYAIAATKIAELQTLDAIVARAEALERSEQVQVNQPINA